MKWVVASVDEHGIIKFLRGVTSPNPSFATVRKGRLEMVGWDNDPRKAQVFPTKRKALQMSRYVSRNFEEAYLVALDDALEALEEARQQGLTTL